MIAMSRERQSPVGRLLSHLSFVAGLLVVASPALSQPLPGGNPATPEQVRFYHSDALGSVRAVTDIDGQIVSRSDYLPFGEQIPPEKGRGDLAGYSVDARNKQKFTGKERDGENGLDYFGTRYFSGAQGRFTSPDPAFSLPAHALDPQQWNRYTYVRNNPFKFVDPDGRAIKLATTLFKVARAVYKGEDIRSTVTGVVSAAATIVSLDPTVGSGARLVATGALIGELSGATDLVKGAKALANGANALDNVNDARRAAERAEPGQLQDMADQIRNAGQHPFTRERRTIAVGRDADGALHAGSSNGFDAGQRRAAEGMGIDLVRSPKGTHAEEDLLNALPDLSAVGTSKRSPCGPSEHNCLGQLRKRGVRIDNH